MQVRFSEFLTTAQTANPKHKFCWHSYIITCCTPYYLTHWLGMWEIRRIFFLNMQNIKMQNTWHKCGNRPRSHFIYFWHHNSALAGLSDSALVPLLPLGLSWTCNHGTMSQSQCRHCTGYWCVYVLRISCANWCTVLPLVTLWLIY